MYKMACVLHFELFESSQLNNIQDIEERSHSYVNKARVLYLFTNNVQ